MGGWFSQSILSDLDDLETRLDAILSGSGAKNVLLRSVSFGNYGRGGFPTKKKSTLSRSYGSAKLISCGLHCKEPITVISSEMAGKKRDEAALKLQKVYKSFRTRRRLADCAVMVEQRWWKLLDFAELKRSSVSFFDIERPETAISRWSRARTRAAKVGKGLSKDKKARKLALQHWLEAIDPRHRYGHNLQFYYVKWLRCESKQPFFYWLDIGEGKEVNLENCPRAKLQQQCIKYLGPMERKAYEVLLEGGKFSYKESGKVIDTREEVSDTKWIFVLSTSKALYVGPKSKGTFQHSSFLAGGATLSAGRLEVEDGILKAVWPHSGHYLPTEENFDELMKFLEEQNVDLTNVKKSPVDKDDKGYEKSKNASIRSDSISKENNQSPGQQNLGPRTQDDMPKLDPNPSPINSRFSRVLHSKVVELEIPKKRHNDYGMTNGMLFAEEDCMVSKLNLFGDDDVDEDEDKKPVVVPKDKIMKRIDSHKGTGSYQLARQLSTRWSTGAGPRIGCIRDYPSELQFQVLEQANLSPRSKGATLSPRNLSKLSQRILLGKTALGLDTLVTEISKCNEAIL